MQGNVQTMNKNLEWLMKQKGFVQDKQKLAKMLR